MMCVVHCLQIERVRIMGHDRYLVAHTAETLLLGDLASCKLSEVRVVILVYAGMLLPCLYSSDQLQLSDHLISGCLAGVWRD